MSSDVPVHPNGHDCLHPCKLSVVDDRHLDAMVGIKDR